MIRSMTGFARATGETDGRSWAWEIKSVNGRGLEVRLRLPPGFDHLELACRKATAARLSRGNVSASLTVTADKSNADFSINEANLDAAIAAVELVQSKIACETPRAEAILTLKGVVQNDTSAPDEAALANLSRTLLEGFNEALTGLETARAEEGEKLHAVLRERLSAAASLRKEAAEAAEKIQPLFKKRLENQLSELLTTLSLSDDRLAQEASLLAVKADVREELDRLEAHLESAEALLSEQNGPIGRQFDFLVQEFNREANTLCAKVPDLALKQIGLALKTVIDQMREQVQNVE
ncbi:MAG: YicC/YloC family endoribonuclease [Pseudomonadota bacterium]